MARGLQHMLLILICFSGILSSSALLMNNSGHPLTGVSPLGLAYVSDVGQLMAALANSSIDRIVLGAGQYKLTATLSIARNVSIEAAAVGTAVLDGQRRVSVLHISSGEVSLTGLGITGGSCAGITGVPLGWGGGVIIEGGRVNFSNCQIHDNSCTKGGGAVIWGGEVNFQSCKIHSNSATYGDAGGVEVAGGQPVVFESCQIYSNRGWNGGGVHVARYYKSPRPPQAIFHSCQIYSNTATQNGGGGVSVDVGHVEFQSCQIFKNSAVYGANIFVNYNDNDVCSSNTTVSSVSGRIKPCPTPGYMIV